MLMLNFGYNVRSFLYPTLCLRRSRIRGRNHTAYADNSLTLVLWLVLTALDCSMYYNLGITPRSLK